MRALLLTGLTLVLSVAGAGKTSASGPVHVSGYTKANGTSVAPYYRRSPGTASTSSSTSTVYSSCADARAAGRWNILKTDADYSANLDRDNDGVACEAGSTGSDAAPAGATGSTTGTVSYNPTPWALVGQAYPEWLGEHLAWSQNSLICTAEARNYEQAFLNDGTGVTPAWRGTLGFVAGLPMATDSQRVDATNSAHNIVSPGAWLTAGGRAARRMWLPDSPETVYAVEMRPLGATQAAICISTLAAR